jgi:hypothetical protein
MASAWLPAGISSWSSDFGYAIMTTALWEEF